MAYNDEDNYLLLSGIQHFQFCKRQWALIHIEQQWEENVKTIEGQHLHRNADQPFTREKRGDKLVVRAMSVKSHELKLTGICDVVEFVQDSRGVEIRGAEGKYIAYPVEYKRGKPKTDESDVLQLAAQALCLEEMLLCDVQTGYIFYQELKHRIEVPLTDDVKQRVRVVAAEMHDYYKRNHTPKVKGGPYCKNCSLQSICLPALMNKRTVKSYIEGKIRDEASS
ncbi:CRISPR-associated protein Cas4 [Paenibacillus thiaminolyticus]|uniref:CRISPR-associated exonuclease Cas4 n=1 Tax=Paenibacillus thiaminolyticus TaxID=49283 RepID=A0A3A3H3Z3_PANTH|nr:CRISPR-associated protein Cas4 [Paenibacillus thiaminolyticus]RJG26212.1 CRISPR-associated protein Cas4 [Paenibacillus thiaminolyticus]